MYHKFYYYEYSDDGGLTWTFGDYRRHLISIIDITKDNPYQVCIRNENNQEIDRELFYEAAQQLEAVLKILDKL